MIRNEQRTRRSIAWLVLSAIVLLPVAIAGQTRVTAPSNKYKIEDDIRLGQQASQQVRQQMPLVNDGYIDNYVERVGQRLVNAIPAEHRHSQFRYTFDVVNARDINAFALPGGPMFINRGMIESARREGEMAGVMAHEIVHVALRHATAQATETQKFQIGSVLGQIIGGVVGGVPGAIIGAGSQIGFGAGALKYSRKYETQADILGAQIMARAGYDPRDLAEMFRTIERQGGGSGGPEWLSSHPNPGNRYERIIQEAALLRVNPNNAIDNTRDFQQVQARLRSMGTAPTMAEIARSGQRYPSGESSDNYPRGERVVYPSGRYRTVSAGNLFSLRIPDNWREASGSGSSVTYSPPGAYGNVQGQFVFSHGVMVGAANVGSANLRQGTEAFINALLQNNPYLRQQRGYQRVTIDRRQGLATQLAGRSPLLGQNEIVTVYTAPMRDGNLAYIVAVAPQSDYNRYQRTFSDVVSSINLN